MKKLAPKINSTLSPTMVKSKTPNSKAGNSIQGLKWASNRIKVNVVSYAQDVESACQAFENYSKSKVKKIEGKITGEKLAGILVGSILEIVGGRIGAGTLGRKLSTAVYKQFAREFRRSAEKAAKEDDSVDALRKTIAAVVSGARDAALNLKSSIPPIFDQEAQKIINKVNSNTPLDPNEEKLLSLFNRVGPKEADSIIEQQFGIPSASSAKEIHLAIYESLVEQFELKFILATASLKETIVFAMPDVLPSSPISLQSKAKKQAQKASGNRRRQLSP